jgi:hypothetical protein
MSVFKSFPIPVHESSVEVRVDAFKVMNHPAFGNPNTGLQGSNASAINNSRFSGLIPSARHCSSLRGMPSKSLWALFALAFRSSRFFASGRANRGS